MLHWYLHRSTGVPDVVVRYIPHSPPIAGQAPKTREGHHQKMAKSSLLGP